jgi:aspartate carbamoyltransferase catalytic subunit
VSHLVSIRDLSLEDAQILLSQAREMSQVNDRAIKKLPTLRGRTIVNLFYENSTRTRVSFEIAATRLSADVINISADASSVSKGESLADTVRTLEALDADCIVIRHPESGAPQQLVTMNWTNCAVVNAGDGIHEHPTQALLDALTMQQSFGSDLTGLRVLIVGDISHSRVARSNVLLLNLLGAEVELAGPSELLPSEFKSLGAKVSHDFDQSLSHTPDVVMMLRVQKERMLENFSQDESSYVAAWSLTKDRLNRVGANAIIMHPGPMNRGLEICSEAADDSRSAILRQVSNGVSVRMAVLRRVLAGDA